MSVKKLLLNIEDFFGIQCQHRAVKNYNCSYCPDCGKKVAVRWVSIKCKQCGQLRKASNKNLFSITPKKDFCFNCGSSKWMYQYYYDSNIPDKLREISVKQVVTRNENPFRDTRIDFDTKIWVENPQGKSFGQKYRSNVIKSKKFKV